MSISVIMLTLNEGHNIKMALEGLRQFATYIYIVDSFSSDDTVDIALDFGATVVQRRFDGFSDQWNFALSSIPFDSEWVMKLDPDERLSQTLKSEITSSLSDPAISAIKLKRRLFFMGKALPVTDEVVRIWRSGRCHFGSVLVNEHPIIDGPTLLLKNELAHLDSPNLEHWLNKQNIYSTLEAISSYDNLPLAFEPKLFSFDHKRRRMWLKKNFKYIPLRFLFVFLYYYFFRMALLSGYEGYIWSRLRSDVFRLRHYKLYEMIKNGRKYPNLPYCPSYPAHKKGKEKN